MAFAIAGIAGILWVGAPAWAAPVTRPHAQTVPQPTPTTGIPTPIATRLPDDNDSDSGSNDSSGSNGNAGTGTGSNESTDPNNPNITFPQNPGTGTGTGGVAAPTLTALVNANGVNLREGPGTSFNVLGNIPANTQITVLSRNEENTWWYICCLPDTETRGWVSVQLLTPQFDAAQAETLIPIFGTEPVAQATPVPANTQQAKADKPLAVDFMLSPYFVWQGITATITITVNNPNNVDAMAVVLSDELPAGLTLIEAEADGDGTVEIVESASGQPLLLFRWATIPADTAVTATIIAEVAPDLEDGDVLDNLVAIRGRNIVYSTSAVTIGLPPILPPDFK